MNKIILASTSPRRKELLEREGIDFIIDASSIEEILDEALPLEERLKHLAKQKAIPIHHKYPNDVVIAADTVVVLDDMIIGKAKDKDDARRILMMLSSREHVVMSAVAIYVGDKLYNFVEKTIVCFKDISSMIDWYIESNEWLGKAGAYGIQGTADCFVEYVKGDIDSVIGLPVKRVIDILNKYNEEDVF